MNTCINEHLLYNFEHAVPLVITKLIILPEI
jgi:hypothetical protein